MELRLPIAVSVYLASYLPLSIILLIQDAQFDKAKLNFDLIWPNVSIKFGLPLSHPFWAIGCVGLCFFCLIVSLIVLSLPKVDRKIKIEETKHIPADLMNYVLPYVVSFMGLDYTDEGKLWGFVVFFFWIFVITQKSGQVILNPVLTVFGWRLYDVRYTHEGGSSVIYSNVALSKIALEPLKVYQYYSMQGVVIIK